VKEIKEFDITHGILLACTSGMACFLDEQFGSPQR
jgi:hypothetical protein